MLLSLALGYRVNPKWYIFTAFVGSTSSSPRHQLVPGEISLLKFLGVEAAATESAEGAVAVPVAHVLNVPCRIHAGTPGCP